MVMQIIKKALFLTAVVLGVSTFAAEETAIVNQGYEIDASQMLGTYNAPARYDVNGSWDLYLQGSLILWQAMEDGTDLGSAQSTTSITNHPNQVIHMDYDYKPGFKLTLGSNLGIDEWTGILDYTFLHFKQKKSKALKAGDTYTLHPYYALRAAVTSTATSSMKSHWEMGFDIIDLSFARSAYVGTKLTMAPFFGVKSGWIDQKLNRTTVNTSAETFKTIQTSETWLLGPRIGVNSNWLLDDGFRFFGNVAASVFYQHFNQYANEYKVADPITSTVYSHETNGNLNSALELGVGFGWGTYFWENKMHFDFLVGYDLNVYFNQNMMDSQAQQLRLNNNISVEAGDLMMHGFTFSTRFDF